MFKHPIGRGRLKIPHTPPWNIWYIQSSVTERGEIQNVKKVLSTFYSVKTVFTKMVKTFWTYRIHSFPTSSLSARIITLNSILQIQAKWHPFNPVMHGRFYRPISKVLWEVVKWNVWIFFLHNMAPQQKFWKIQEFLRMGCLKIF